MKNIKKFKINYLTLYFLLISFLCGYIKYAIIIFLIVLFHELGHVIICKIFKYKINSIEIFPFGGVTKIDKLLNNSIIKDLLISIMGIIFQLFIFLITDNVVVLKYNKYIMIFNLLPIIPLDGSKLLFEIYALIMPYKKVIKYYYLTSFIFIIIYFIFNYKYNLNNYMIIILFIYKTIEVIKNRNILYEKFILERALYDIKFNKVKNKNEDISKYFKDTKYYYKYNNKIISDKEYLKNKYYLDKHK